MAKLTKLETYAIGIVAVIGIAVSAVVKFFETVGFVIPSVILASIAAIYFWNRSAKAKEKEIAAQNRQTYLVEKYGDEEIVNRIINETIWIGQTEEQLRESLGHPEDIDQKVLKTKKKEVWKYGHRGGNRYAYRITLDNDVIIGWDEKA